MMDTLCWLTMFVVTGVIVGVLGSATGIAFGLAHDGETVLEKVAMSAGAGPTT